MMTEDMQKENDVVLLRNWINRAQAEYATRCQLAYLLRDLLDAETVGERDIVLARIKNHPDIKFRKMAGSGEPTVEPDYRSFDCAKCGRMRVEKSGICEKCKWNNDDGEYVPDPVLCGEMISMHERDSTNDKPCVLEEGYPGDCAPRLPESVHDPAGIEHSVKMSRPNLYVGGHKICSAEKAKPVAESVMPQGRWPDTCQQRAFVEGMKWWQFHHNGSTVFGSERDEAEKEAIYRYGIPSESTTGETPVTVPTPDLEFIGSLRRRLFMPYDCRWNGYVRDITAELEESEGVLVSRVYQRIFKDFSNSMTAKEFDRVIHPYDDGKGKSEPATEGEFESWWTKKVTYEDFKDKKTLAQAAWNAARAK